MRSFIATAASLAVLIATPLTFGSSALAADAASNMLAGPCANCHGTDGRSPGPIPSIAGIPFTVLKAQLDAFRNGLNPSATVMTRLAKGFTEAEVETLARHFSEMKK